MARIMDTLDLICDEFSLFSDPRDKYVYLVDLAKDAVGLSQEEQIETNRIHGCTSQAWVISKNIDGIYSFHTDSDAMIVKGLLSLLVKIFNGQTASEIRSVDGSVILNSIGLLGAVSNQRTNGFSSAVEKIQQLAS